MKLPFLWLNKTPVSRISAMVGESKLENDNKVFHACLWLPRIHPEPFSILTTLLTYLTLTSMYICPSLSFLLEHSQNSLRCFKRLYTKAREMQKGGSYWMPSLRYSIRKPSLPSETLKPYPLLLSWSDQHLDAPYHCACRFLHFSVTPPQTLDPREGRPKAESSCFPWY